MDKVKKQPQNLCLELISQKITLCRNCPRLVSWRESVASTKRRAFINDDYWGRPVPGFGDPKARILVIGLAPGAHGSNRTGRMFTGDASGDFLFPALHKAGFANQANATSRDDGLRLHDLFISAVCRCVPPGNKPTTSEVKTCLFWLESEINCLTNLEGIVALGRISLEGIMNLPVFSQIPKRTIRFGHGLFYRLPEGLPWLLCSYHPSRQNTQTGRLTEAMFDDIWNNSKILLDSKLSV